MDSAATNNESVEDAAARWFWKRDSGAWTDADQAQFDAWLQASTAHRIAYIRLNAGWKGAARMKALGAGIPAGVIPPRGAWGDTRFPGGAARKLPAPVDSGMGTTGIAGEIDPVADARMDNRASSEVERHPAMQRWALAAAVILAVATGLFLHADFLRGARYSTPVGGLDTVPLADGSHVTLNTDTRIRVELGENERRIELDRGEAFFEVAKDPSRPFVVQVDDKRVIAIGTKFSVRRDADDIQVVVTEGRVKLEQEPAALRTARNARQAAPSTALGAGAIARTSQAQVLVRESSAPEVEYLLSWRNGFLVFDATTLAEAVAEFNRYGTRKIVIEDPSIAGLRIGGNFRSNNADAFLWLLQTGFPVEVERRDDSIVLSAR